MITKRTLGLSIVGALLVGGFIGIVDDAKNNPNIRTEQHRHITMRVRPNQEVNLVANKSDIIHWRTDDDIAVQVTFLGGDENSPCITPGTITTPGTKPHTTAITTDCVFADTEDPVDVYRYKCTINGKPCADPGVGPHSGTGGGAGGFGFGTVVQVPITSVLEADLEGLFGYRPKSAEPDEVSSISKTVHPKPVRPGVGPEPEVQTLKTGSTYPLSVMCYSGTLAVLAPDDTVATSITVKKNDVVSWDRTKVGSFTVNPTTDGMCQTPFNKGDPCTVLKSGTYSITADVASVCNNHPTVSGLQILVH